MLFLKRMSDVFDEKREQLRKRFKHLPDAKVKELLQSIFGAEGGGATERCGCRGRVRAV